MLVLGQPPRVLTMDIIAEVKRLHFVRGEGISLIVHSLKISRPTVRKNLLI
jgi:hypothetical protein